MAFLQLSEWKARGVEVFDPPEKDPVGRFLADSEERVAFDLHVSDVLIRNHRQIQIPLEGYALAPGSLARILVRERLTMPDDLVGTIHSRASLAALGFTAANLKIDPLFVGHLEISVFNQGERSIRIERGLAFASLLVGELTSPVTGPHRSPPNGAGLAFTNWRVRLRTGLPYLLTVVASVAGAVISRLL